MICGVQWNNIIQTVETMTKVGAKSALKPKDHLFLVDGSTFIFRAFHALPPLTRKSDGLPVGAVSGFCNMLWKLLQEGDPTSPGTFPTHFGVIFDYSEKTFRNDIYPEYKAHRPETPEDLRPQFGIIRDAVRAFNVSCIEQEGWEADDIIATYAVQAAKTGATVTIISSDKDLMQLIRPGICMVDTIKDRRIETPQVEEKFGVGPDKVVEVQALAGDSTDNVPGVQGIGVKTAAELINHYGDLETLLNNAGEIKQNKRRENLIKYAELARISHKLVTLSQEVPVKVPVDDLAVQKLNGIQAISFLKAMEFTSLTKRVAEKTETEIDAVDPANLEIKGWDPNVDVSSSPEELEELSPSAEVKKLSELMKSIPFDVKKYETVTTRQRLEEWVSEATELGIVAVDTETNSLDAMQADLVGFSLSTAPGKACYVPLQHRVGEKDLLGGGELSPDQIPVEDALNIIRPMLEDNSVLKIAHNLKYDWLVLYRYGIDIQTYDDTMLISYALDAGRGQNGMDALSERWFGHKPISFKELTGTGKLQVTFDQVPIESAAPYAAEDADITFRFWKIMKPRLIAEKMTEVYEKLERPMVTVLARMEERGVCVDQQKLSRLSGEFAQESAKLEDEIQNLAGQNFNVGSTKQLGEILFDKLKYPENKKTTKGARSTDADVLEDFATREEFSEEKRLLPSRIMEWRQLTKLKSTYTDALPRFINSNTNRVHTSFALASTTTGRLSSSDPNLQNIPIRTEVGRKIRQAFVSPKGTKLVSADYSQIELRILAHIAEIPQLRKAFADGIDIHALTASEMFGVPVEGMDSMVRRRAKAINFGIIYGISAHGLANQLSISRTEAGDYIKKYFERFPGIRDYMEETKKFAHENGYVNTIFGRKAHYPGINTGNFSHKAFLERAAINAPIQGSAADIIRRAMIRMDRVLASKNISAKMLLQVHDELIFEIPNELIEKTIPVVKEVMENAANPAVQLQVPLQVDAHAGDNWDEAH